MSDNFIEFSLIISKCISKDKWFESTNQSVIRFLACFQDADVGFVIDASASIDDREYEDQKHAVKSLVQNLHESGDGFRTGLIQFSADAEVIYYLKDPESAINATIDSMTRQASTTRIDKALRLAQNDLFTTANGDRAFTPNLLFLAIDGSQTKAAGWEDPVMVADEIRAMNIDIFVVGIGIEVSQYELSRLAGGRADRVYYAPTFDGFLEIGFLKNLTKAACVGKL